MNTPITRFKMIASSYLFYIKDGKILLSRRKNTGYADGMYSVPAGHVEEGETLVDCLIRESQEEVGLTFTAGDVRLVHVMHRQEIDIRMDFFFVVDTWAGDPMNREPDKCDDLSWFSINALPDNTVPYVRAAIESWQKGVLYANRGWPARNA